jgi:precorrin-3B C17-methyltransferase
VGIGPGDRRLRTIAAEEAIEKANFVVGYKPYLDMIADLLHGKAIFCSGMGKEVDRAKAAVDLLAEGSVALVSSGDPNVYGMAGLGLEIAPDPEKVEVMPGVTSFAAAACRAGLVFRRSIAAISLSDLLTPKSQIEQRLRLAAEFEMPIALYNPRSMRREQLLMLAMELNQTREVLVAKNVSREGEEIFWTTTTKIINDETIRNKIDMSTLIIISGEGTFRGNPSRDANLNLVGIGPGNGKHLTYEAHSLLKTSAKVFGAERYLQSVADLTSAEKITHNGSCPEKMLARYQEASAAAQNGKSASILAGGDPSIFGSSWRILQSAAGKCALHISPGVSAFSSVAAVAGAPLVNDFVLLSDPKEGNIARLAAAGFGIIIYNVEGHEIAQLLQKIDSNKPCVLARDVTRPGEENIIMRAGDLADAKPSGFRFTLLISSANSFIKGGRIIARRGYESKYCY